MPATLLKTVLACAAVLVAGVLATLGDPLPRAAASGAGPDSHLSAASHGYQTGDSGLSPQVSDAAPFVSSSFAYTDLGTIGDVDAGDLLVVVFSETMSADLAASGSSIEVRDSDGTNATITCGAGVECRFLDVPELRDMPMRLDQALGLLMTEAPELAAEGGSREGLQYPLNIVSAGAALDTTGDALDLDGSRDRLIDNSGAIRDDRGEDLGFDDNFAAVDETPAAEGDAGSGGDDGMSPWLIILLVVGGVAVLGAAAFAVIRLRSL